MKKAQKYLEQIQRLPTLAKDEIYKEYHTIQFEIKKGDIFSWTTGGRHRTIIKVSETLINCKLQQ